MDRGRALRLVCCGQGPGRSPQQVRADTGDQGQAADGVNNPDLLDLLVQVIALMDQGASGDKLPQ